MADIMVVGDIPIGHSSVDSTLGEFTVYVSDPVVKVLVSVALRKGVVLLTFT